VHQLVIDQIKSGCSNWTSGINKDTEPEGYFIDSAGSLWAGQPNTQNTIDEIMALGKQHGFRWEVTNINYHISARTLWKFEVLWLFIGNCEGLSNAFRVWIWDKKLAHRIKDELENMKLGDLR
jgi:hypothetical protein